MTALPDPPDLFPFEEGAFRHRVGLRPVAEDQWLATGPYADALVAHRHLLLAERPADVEAWTAAAGNAAAEALDVVRAWVAAHAPDRLRFDPGAGHPVGRAGRLAAEDLCVMLPGPEGAVLGAASLCFPTRWRLHDKLGRPMAAIHEPVPRYAAQIGAATDKAMGHLPAEGAVRGRANWSLLDDGALHQPSGRAGAHTVPPSGVGEGVWLRVEWQTLRRLPRTGAALFTILVLQRSLGSLADRPDVLDRLAGALAAMPDDVASYKGLADLRSTVLTWVRARTR